MNDLRSPRVVPEVAGLGEKGLDIMLANGKAHYFNYYWLRDNCPTSFSPVTRERSFDIFHLEAAPRAKTAAVEGDALVIDWQNEDHVTRMPLSWLETFCDGKRRHDPADLVRVPWFSDHYPSVPRFSQPDLVADDATRAKWIEAMLIHGFTIVTDMPDSDAGLTQTAELMGFVRPTFFGTYFDVKTHINPTNTAYTAGALELHTDTPAEEFARESSSSIAAQTRFRGAKACIPTVLRWPMISANATPRVSGCSAKCRSHFIANMTAMMPARANSSSSWTDMAR